MSAIKLVFTAVVLVAIAVAFYAGTLYMDAHHGRFPVVFFLLQVSLGALAGPLVGANLRDWREVKRIERIDSKQEKP